MVYTIYRMFVIMAYLLIINCWLLQGRQLENGLLALIEFLTQARHKLNHSKTLGVFGICSNINCWHLQGRQLENGLLALIEFLTQARPKLNNSKTPGVFGICSNKKIAGLCRGDS
jgi:hypothetical protein